jgi:glycosyltransferase involved in cell wall biosynthesis
MRVVFVTHNYPRTTGDLAGAFLHPLALALAARGLDVRVIAPSDAGRGGSDTLDGIPVTRVRYGAPGRERYAYTGRMAEAVRTPAGLLALRKLHLALQKGVRAAAADGGPTVVHAHWWIPAGLAAPRDLPTVVTLHGTDARLLERLHGARVLARRALRPPRIVTAVSRFVAGQVERATGIAVPDHRVCPMPVSGAPSRSTGGGGAVFVGRLTRQKRLDLVLEALNQPAASACRLLTVVGDGPERPALEALAARLALGDRVRFVGRVDSTAVAGHLAAADLFLLPARDEGFGLAAVEALLAGVPVIVCADGGGLREVVAGGGGMAVEPEPEAIAGAIESMLSDPRAPNRAFDAGRRWAERLAPVRVAERFEGWYREALGE